MAILKAIGNYLLGALPQIVTITSVVVSAVVQVKASRQETQRAIENYKQMMETERIKSEEARKAALLERQLSEQRENYAALSELYAKILDDFYPGSGKTIPVSACKTIYAAAMKMLGYCQPGSNLRFDLQQLTDYLFSKVISVDDADPVDCKRVESWIRSIAYDLHDMTISHSLEQGTLQTKLPVE